MFTLSGKSGILRKFENISEMSGIFNPPYFPDQNVSSCFLIRGTSTNLNVRKLLNKSYDKLTNHQKFLPEMS